MNGDNKKLIIYAGLFFGIIIIIYGLIKLINEKPAAVQQVSVVAQEQVAPSNIVVAHKLILRGAKIGADDLAAIKPPGARPANAETSVQGLVGKFAVADIAPDAAILSSDVSADPTAAGLAVMVPAGFRAIEMRTNDEIAVGNFLRPGDHVDIELVLRETVLPKQTDAMEHVEGNPSEGRTLLQDVRVLAVGETLSNVATPPQENAAGRKVEPPHAVTLAMTPDQITQFTLAGSLGTLRLALRNPTDTENISIGSATLSDIRGPTPPGAGAANQGGRPIELIVGNKIRHIYSSNPSEKQ